MIDVFERLAPTYSRVVRKLAIDVWYNRANVKEFLAKAEHFKRRYESELMEYFQKRKYSFSPRRIKELANRWLGDQVLIPRKLSLISVSKKGNLIETLDTQQREEVAQLFEKSKVKPEGRVVSVVSFSDNLEARALQLGEDAAFDLGREINHDMISQNNSVYKWVTQHDKHVRPTHKKLGSKIFSYDSPPTTIDKYGHQHTGNPGTDWGCRCYEEPATGKPRLNFIARE